jgi:hypothetical protein
VVRRFSPLSPEFPLFWQDNGLTMTRRRTGAAELKTEKTMFKNKKVDTES